MDDENCATLCEALHNNESLEILDLSGNNLGKYEVSVDFYCMFHVHALVCQSLQLAYQINC